MPSSNSTLIPLVVRCIEQMKPSTVLDIGVGFGAGSADGSVWRVTPAGATTQLASGSPLDDPTDLDVDPRPFADGVNLAVADTVGNKGTAAVHRVPLGGGSATTIASGMV